MFVITDKAIRQFKNSLEAIADTTLSLRISARRSEQGIMYKMGFDKAEENDASFEIDKLSVIVDPESMPNVQAMVIDYRLFEGQEQFVFINPDDVDVKEENESFSGCNSSETSSFKSCIEKSR